MALSKMDYWRLVEELSVVDAAILMTGNNPSETISVYDVENATEVRDKNGHIVTIQNKEYDGYSPSFKALKGAILSNSLRAVVRLPMRKAEHPHFGEYDTPRSENFDDFATESELQLGYDMHISRTIGEPSVLDEEFLEVGQTYSNFDVKDLYGCRFLYVSKEPDWNETTINVSDLKAWLEGKGMHPPFFFPNRPTADFKDKSNPRYAPKLAACIEAWEQVKAPKNNMSVKQTLSQWLQSNAASFGVGESGIVSPKMVKELAAIVNWKPKGGAPPTARSDSVLDEDESEAVENYQFGYPENSDDDPSIPF